MANTFKFGNGNWAVKEGAALAYNDENNNFKPLPFDFTRASSATRVNREGLIEVVGQNKPRIDFLNNTSGHLLLEPSRMNSIANSENLNSWLKGSGITVTTNNITSPDGNLTADKIEKISQNYTFVRQSLTATTGVFSVFVKKGNYRYVGIRNNESNSISHSVFDFDTESFIVTQANRTLSFEKFPNGWYRLIDYVSVNDSNTFRGVCIADSSGNEIGTDIPLNSYIYVWGGQLELGSTYATSYIPTEGLSVTRSDEYAIDAGNSAVFSDTELSWFLDIEGFAEDGTTRYISISDGGGSPYTNGYAILYRNDGALRIFRNGLDFADAICIVDIDQTIRQKIAIRYKQNDMKVYINGVSQSLNGSYVFQSMSGIDRMRTNQQNSTSGSNAFDGKIYEMKVWNEALSDSQLQALTS